jgi:hypothetical protein
MTASTDAIDPAAAATRMPPQRLHFRSSTRMMIGSSIRGRVTIRAIQAEWTIELARVEFSVIGPEPSAPAAMSMVTVKAPVARIMP